MPLPVADNVGGGGGGGAGAEEAGKVVVAGEHGMAVGVVGEETPEFVLYVAHGEA